MDCLCRDGEYFRTESQRLSKEEKELNRRALELLENDAKTNDGAKYRLKRYLKFYDSKNHQDKALKSLYHYRLKLIESFKKE